MSYVTKQFILAPGTYTISSPKFAYTRIHRVERAGTIGRPVNGAPAAGTREYNHNTAAATLTFGIPGAPLGARGDAEVRELVQVTLLEP